ncbi:MAG: hypothetical protein OXC40_04755 [Proteobacteria bacterium]|nr:hypothetical protein [Pseudomonadota bacterium]
MSVYKWLQQNIIWLPAILIGICMMTIPLFNDFIETRRKYLQNISEILERELLMAKSHLANVSMIIAEDQVLSHSVAQKKKNSYSAELKNQLSLHNISHIGIYNNKCQSFFTVAADNSSTRFCEQQSVNRLLWYTHDRNTTLFITRPLGEQYLVSVALNINNYILNSPPLSRALTAGTLKWHQQPQNDIKTPAVSYLYAPGIKIYDHHKLSGLLNKYTSPYSETSGNPWPLFMMFFLSILLASRHYYLRFFKAKLKLTAIDNLLQQAGQKLKMKPPISFISFTQTMEKKIQELANHHSRDQTEIARLKLQGQQLKKRMAKLSYLETITSEVERNALILQRNLLKQSDLEDNTKDFLEMIHRLTQKPVAEILKSWQKDIDERGARKFLRSSLERSSDENRHISVLEAHIESLLAALEQLTLLSNALLAECQSKNQHNDYIKELAGYWSDLFGQQQTTTPKLRKVVDLASWQIRETLPLQVEIQKPNWLEPSTFNSELGQMIRCILYELFSFLAMDHQEQDHQHLRLTLHFLPESSHADNHYVSYFDHGLFSGLLITHDISQGLQEQNHNRWSRFNHLAKKTKELGESFRLKLEFHKPIKDGHTDHIECYFLSWRLPSTTKTLSSSTTTSQSRVKNSSTPLTAASK